MALTQTTHLPGPVWDEEVVPALRKRLESESRTLAKRMSFLDESSLVSSADRLNSNFVDSWQPPQHNGSPHSRPAGDPAAPFPSTQPTASSSRSRTYSQTTPGDLKRLNGSSNGHANGASVSPRQYDAKPSRIPQATRRRADSTSSYSYGTSSPPMNSSTPFKASSPNPSDQLWSLPENLSRNASRSTVSVSSQQVPPHTGIMNEYPPFQPGSVTSSGKNSYHDISQPMDRPRPSIDSEEQPFEHWYRGDVSRNGGVGELKVGKRKEMLDIANYGHQYNSERPAGQRNAITDAIKAARGRRTRADSIGGIGKKERESFYMDDDRAAELVLNESPLTDADAEFSDGAEGSDYYDEYSRSMGNAYDTSQPDLRSMTPTHSHLDQPRSSSKQQNPTPSRIPTTSRSGTPTFTRASSEPPTTLLSPSTSSTPRSRPQQNRATSPNSTPTQKSKRAASPATLTSASKKTKHSAAQATRARLEAQRKEQQEKENQRSSAASYPSPVDGLENAIPEWTQPKLQNGNWDDVVLPVVAKKKGIQDGYERADGSPKPSNSSNPIAPAPGTFGWDHSKYRPPLEDELDEFGRPVHPPAAMASTTNGGPEPSSPARPPPISTAYDDVRVGPGGSRPAPPHPPASPSPFSHYVATPGTLPATTTRPPQDKLEMEMEEKEESGGCCSRCIVM